MAKPEKRETDIHNVLFCGIGGQGILKASEICGVAAVIEGYRVKKSEVHGMAQRGGSVESHLRFGKKVNSPLIQPGEVDFLVCFHPDEEERLKHFLSSNGLSFRTLLDTFPERNIDKIFLNTFFLGILSSYLPMKTESWLDALQRVFTRARDENREVFYKGLELGRVTQKQGNSVAR